ncbi:MAG TPA: hypothetical protein VIJ39_05770 [Solirubrobacteraceae bacterium]
MNARRLTLAALVSLCAWAGVLVAWSGPALAARGHLFGSAFGGQGSGDGQLNEPSGVAVSEASGDVYVSDTGNNRVERFSSTGTYLGQFDGSGSFEVEGKVETGTAAGGGGLSGETPTGQFSAPGGIAIDNACQLHRPVLTEATTPTCSQFDPSEGDVYVADAGHNVVDKFTSTGGYIGQMAGPTSGSFGGLATDSNGTVWVYGGNEIDGFSNAAVNVFLSTRDSRSDGFPVHGPGFAVNSKDDFYVVTESGCSERGVSRELYRYPTKLNGSGEVLEHLEVGTSGCSKGFLFGEEDTSAATVELTSEDVYIDNVDTVARFGPDGSLIERLGAEHLSSGSGVGVSSSSEEVYVADSAADKVDIFVPEPVGTPKVDSQGISLVTGSSATLNAAINPKDASTEYHFEYGPSTSYGESDPSSDVSIGSGFEVHEVSVHPQDLLAHTTYHFRVVAHNSFGTTYGEDQTFITQTAGGALVLPDGRSWELVTPADKQGALFFGLNIAFFSNAPKPFVAEASANGNAMVDLASAPTEAQPQGNSEDVSVLSTRGAGGWSSQVISPPHEEGTGPSVNNGGEYGFFSEDLSRGVVSIFGNFDKQLSSEATEATPYLRTDYLNGDVDQSCQTSCFQPLVTAANTQKGVAFGQESNGHCGAAFPCGPKFIDATPDASHIVLASEAQLTDIPDEEGTYGGSVEHEGEVGRAYEWSNGQLQPLYQLPNSEGGRGVYAGELSTVAHQLSDNGSVFFSYNGHLYLHDVAKGESVRLDVAQGVQEPVAGGAVFLYASSDGSRVLFSDPQQLTKAAGGGIYACRIVEAAGGPTCELELTSLPGDSLIGGSDDASYLYFVGGGKKLEVAHYDGREWTTTDGPFIGTQPVSGAETPIYRVSPNGSYLTFMSDEDLTGYDTHDVLSGQPDQEVYLYDAGSNKLVCASCDPTGARPVGVDGDVEMLVGGSVEERTWTASTLPPWTLATPYKNRYQPRFLSDSGRLFFNSDDGLVPQDVDGTQDVYEYEPAGVGTCSASSATYGEHSGGCVGLISSGASPEESAFMDASETGGDVFFITQAKLLSQDFDTALDVYDAHECTNGVPCYAPEPVSPPACSTGDSCKAAPSPQPSIFGPAPSATFSGAGNVTTPISTPAVTKKRLTKAQKLARALKACRKKKHKQRGLCEQKARKLLGAAVKSHKANAKRKDRG